MFNALNRFMSRLDGGDPHQRQHEPGSFGFQVLRNTNFDLEIEPWFDFVVGINGRPIDDPNPNLLIQKIRNCAGAAVTLGLWSAKGQRTREMRIPVPGATATLGLSLQYSPIALAEKVWHVLDVAANSPADQATLLPYSDYFLGSPEGALHGESALGELVEDHIGRPLRLYVYNHEYNITREVTIQPNRDWGGEGALGCVLGYGTLHRLPAPLSEPVNAPGETMFDGDSKEESDLKPATLAVQPPPGDDYLIPAQIIDPTSSASSQETVRGKKKERHVHSSNQLIDDYFREEEQKSRELDHAPAPKSAGVPPPPKASGAPPRPDTEAKQEGGTE